MARGITKDRRRRSPSRNTGTLPPSSFHHHHHHHHHLIINDTMSSTATCHPYGEQVNDMLVALSNIGKPVWVLFQHGNSNKYEFFRGEITEINMKKILGEEDTTGISFVDIQHFVVFDDGDKDWYNLAEKEDAGQLMWQEPTEKALSKVRAVKNSKANMKPQETSSSSSAVAQAAVPVGMAGQQGNKKRKIYKADDTDDDDDYYEDSDYDKIRHELNNNGSDKKRARVVCSSDSSADARDYNDNQQKEQAAAARRHFQALGSTTKKWIKMLGLTKAYGSKHDALKIIMDNPNIYVMPEAFEQVFYLTDYLFPGKDYHQTLYARYTTKPGKPVRDALVSIAVLLFFMSML